MRDIFYGKDVRKIFPKEEYKRIEPLDLKPTQLYCIEKYEYQTNTVVLEEVRLLEVEMSNIEGIGNKFIVIEKDDLEKYLHPNTRAEFDYALDKIERMRKNDGKKFNTYVVINTDEPYAYKVIELMKEHGHWGVEI